MYFLEGPDTFSAGWGVLSCSGFTMVAAGEDDYNEVILRCADKATMKLHKAKEAQIDYKSVHRGNQFFLQWNSEDTLKPGGMYEFVWERNGDVMAISKKFEFKEQAAPKQQELRHPMADENMSYKEVRATLRPPKPSGYKVLTGMLSVVRMILSAVLSLFMRLPSILYTASVSSVRISRWSFRQWTSERQMACPCGVLCRPFGFFSGNKCTRATTGIWIRCVLSALVCFWFVRNGPSPERVQVTNHQLKSGSLSSLVDLTEVAASKAKAAFDTVSGAQPAPRGQKGGAGPAGRAVWEAFVAALQPFYWILRTLGWGFYWLFGLVFPALFSWVLLDLTVPTSRCCKCVGERAAAVPGGKKSKAPPSTPVRPCAACAARQQ